ncbi:NAD-dependent epimerase/dehydratase - like 7 [Theobroma cacao]|nr:NAD-dependent epimerase/dehydratase - like 7 [Theobroma cacao]
MDFQDNEPEAVVTQRAVGGALGILKTCLRSKTVKRVVFTSSIASVYFNNKNVDMMDESFWTDVDYVRELESYVSSYAITKTMTEKAVLEFAAEHGMYLVTVVPPLVVGPFICPKLTGCLEEIEGPRMPGLSSKKLLDSGFKFKYGVKDMYDGAIKCCKEKGTKYTVMDIPRSRRYTFKDEVETVWN